MGGQAGTPCTPGAGVRAWVLPGEVPAPPSPSPISVRAGQRALAFHEPKCSDEADLSLFRAFSVFIFVFFFNSSHPGLEKGQLPVAGRAHSGLEEEEEEEGLAWQARRPAPSHCLPRRRRGHVGERGEAGEGTRRRLGGENGRPRQMLRSGQAQSSQLCPPLLSGVPSEEQRRRGAAVPCRAGEAGRQSGTGRGGLAVLLRRAARRFVRSGRRVLGTSEAFLFS